MPGSAMMADIRYDRDAPIAETPRLAALDAMRFIGACCVVWIHAGDTLEHTKMWARWAVPFFTITSIWLLGQSLARKPNAQWSVYAAQRVRRLYGTFLVWCLFYLIARAIKHAVFHRGETISITPDLLWTGSAENLWFLPFLCIATIAAFPLCKLAARLRTGTMIVLIGSFLAACISGLATLSLPGQWSEGNLSFFELVRLALPSVFLGLALVAGNQWFGPIHPSNRLVAAGTVLMAASLIALNQFGRQQGLEALGGLGAMLVALSPSHATWVGRLARLGAYAFGVYIVHLFWVEFIRTVSVQIGLPPSAVLDGFVALAAIVLSLIVSHLLRRTPLIPK